MIKKIIIKKIIFIIVVAMFFPVAKASAVHVYVGVKIAAASTTNTCSATPVTYGGTTYSCGSNNKWSLPGAALPVGTSLSGSSQYGTRITILGTGAGCTVTGNGSSTSGCSILSPVAGSGTAGQNVGNTFLGASHNSTVMGPITPIVPGSNTVIWSNLVDLNTSTNYVIRLATSSYCPGFYSSSAGGGCLVTAPNLSLENQDCYHICGEYGLVANNSSGTVCATDYFSDSSTNNCQVIAALKGSTCSTCNGTSCPSGICPTPANDSTYNYYDASGNCFNRKSSSAWLSCDPIAGYYRVCNCNFNNSAPYQSNDGGFGYYGTFFYFPFTTPSSF
jgi:hypothetical protein